MRFGGIERLYGKGALERLQSAHVAVIGLGGVGSWAVEALARSGVGTLTLIDLDDICVTNVNRQIHAHDGTIGQSKAQALADRTALIHPEATIHVHKTYLTAANATALLEPGIDHCVDAIDSIRDKCQLVCACRQQGIPLVVSGGGGGKRDPSKVATADLGKATNDPLLKRLRKKLRQEHGFSRDLREPFGVPAVFTTENPVFPWSDGRICDRPEPGSSLQLDCASGFGTAAAVTGTLGFTAAAVVIEALLQI